MSNRRFCNTLASFLIQKTLLTEAVLYLLAARFAVRFVPYRLLERFMNRLPVVPEPQGEEREQKRKQVLRAIRQAYFLLPGETVCFPRGIAAQAMLRRRGIIATLHYGAASSCDGMFGSHVWVTDGDIPVTGCRIAGSYRQLAAYPRSMQAE